MLQFELIVPAYNESKNLPLLVQRASDAATKAGLTSNDFQFVIVNNGSKDDSETVLKELSAGPLAAWFRVVNVIVNQGYGYGVLQGLKSTHAPVIGWSHADMQCDPTDAIKAFKILNSHSNTKLFVKGARSGRDWKDRFVSRVFETFSQTILGLKVYEMNAQPKVFRRILLESMANPPFNFAFDMYVLYQAQKQGYEIQTIPVLYPPRIHGVSNWASNFFSRYKTILNMIKYMFELKNKEGRI